MNIFDWAKVIFTNRDLKWWAAFSACFAASVALLVLMFAGMSSCSKAQAERRRLQAIAATATTTTTTAPTLPPEEAFAVSAADAPTVYEGSALMTESGGYAYYAHPSGGTYREPLSGGDAEKLLDSGTKFCIMNGDIYFLGKPEGDSAAEKNARDKNYNCILRTRLTGGENSKIETVYPGNVYDFAAASGTVFFLTGDKDIHFPNSLCKMRPGDEKPDKIYSGGWIPFSDGSRVYWYGGKGVFRINTDGSGKTALSDDVRVNRALLVGDRVYFLTDKGELRRVRSSGGDSEVLVRGCGDFATDGLYLYTIAQGDGASNAESIIRLDMDGGNGKTLCRADVNQIIGAGGGWVYFHEWTADGSLLRRVNYNGEGLEYVGGQSGDE
ncbi:MAG: DUF5050 domain-containing protein [Oscillospiraceae bacterium]|nr:DUF5050 domain-containing protein [Oscillospiraceae bacterium]